MEPEKERLIDRKREREAERGKCEAAFKIDELSRFL